MNLRSEVECLDGGVEREVGEVGVTPGEGRHPLTVSWPGHSPELLAGLEESPAGELHVESPVALVAHHVVQLLPLTLSAGQAEVAPGQSGSLYGEVRDSHSNAIKTQRTTRNAPWDFGCLELCLYGI